MESATLWFLVSYAATLLFSALASAFGTLQRMEPQYFEDEQKGFLPRLYEHWPQELVLTQVLVPFLSMTATLVLGALHYGRSSSGLRVFLVWLGLSALLLFTVALLRTLGARYPATLLRAMGWLYVPFFFLLYPLNSLLGPLLSRTQLARALELTGPLVSVREMQDLMEKEGGDDLLQDTEREMISSIMDMRDTPVREVMIPRIDVKALDVETPYAEARAFVAKVGHSRIPVFKESMDHVVGILYSKDLLQGEAMDREVPLMQVLRKPYFVPETKMVGDLLRRFQTLRQHLAIVVDEYGGTAGIVTLEDVLEEIVGEIRDEYDREERLFELIDEHSARVDAKMDLEELGEKLGHQFAEVEEDFETLGGLLLYHSGRILEPGDELQLDPFTFRVESVQRQRIAKVILFREGLAELVRANDKTDPPEIAE